MEILTEISAASLIAPIVRHGYRTLVSWWTLDDKMPEVDKAFNKVRNELYEVGLLAEGIYLDHIDLMVDVLPSLGESGYVYEETCFIQRLIGYEEGVIYLPSDLPREAYIPGGTLTDTIRHEFAHAWHWFEPKYFDRDWFPKTFGAEYEDESSLPLQMWVQKKFRSRRFVSEYKKRQCDQTRERYYRKELLNEFVSEYAATNSCEDFAETFMTYLRYRHCLTRFQQRPGVYRKLRAVQKAVGIARKELEL